MTHIAMLKILRMQIVIQRIKINIYLRFIIIQTINVTVIMMRQVAGLDKTDQHLEKTEAHQTRTERNRAIHHPGRPFQIRCRRSLRYIAERAADQAEISMVSSVLPDKVSAQRSHNTGEQHSGKQAENNELCTHLFV